MHPAKRFTAEAIQDSWMATLASPPRHDEVGGYARTLFEYYSETKFLSELPSSC